MIETSREEKQLSSSGGNSDSFIFNLVEIIFLITLHKGDGRFKSGHHMFREFLFKERGLLDAKKILS